MIFGKNRAFLYPTKSFSGHQYLLMVVQNRLKRRWSFSGLATMVRLTLMYYVNLFSLLNNPEKDWLNLLEKASISPPEPS